MFKAILRSPVLFFDTNPVGMCVYHTYIQKFSQHCIFTNFKRKLPVSNIVNVLNSHFISNVCQYFVKNDVLNFLRKLSVVKIQTVMICQAPIKML